MKVALVHDYLTQRGGAERVFELLCKRFPTADIFTSLYDQERTIELSDRLVRTTALQKLPMASRYFRFLAPFYYPAFRSLDVQEYDLIISSCSSFAKAVQKRGDATHICFCHNITRFLWDTQTYLREFKEFQLLYPLIKPVFQQMRDVDLKYAKEPDLYIANSSTVQRRIERVYEKPARTINYPIDTRQFTFSPQKDDFYLVSSRFLTYKRIDVIIEAFNWLGRPLKIMGDGPERERLQAIAQPNVEFLGYISDQERAALMSKAKAVIVAALEDYGLVPIEANASGTPVIAYGKGGVLDTIIPGTTGLFFDKQRPDSLIDSVLESDQMEWDYSAIRDHALGNFTEDVFFQRVGELVESTFSDKFSQTKLVA